LSLIYANYFIDSKASEHCSVKGHFADDVRKSVSIAFANDCPYVSERKADILNTR